jgi:UDP-glucose 4-epimerase
MATRPFQQLAGKKILVTGGSGYLAASLLSLLRDVDCQVTRLDLKHDAAAPGGMARIIDVDGDVSRIETWQENLPAADIVFHFAAQTSVYLSNNDPLADNLRNVQPMLYLLETCRQKGLHPVVIFSGTVTVTGMPQRIPVDETHPDEPVTMYDVHKLMAENYLKYYSRQGIVDGAILRLANVYGPGPSSSSADRGILNMMVKKAVNGEDLTLYGKGEFLRDYIYVQDVAAAFLLAAINIAKVKGQHFVLGTGKGTTLAEAFKLVTERVTAKTGKKVNVVSVDPPAGLSLIENRNFVANSGKFTGLTGWQAETSLAAGIDEIIHSILGQ